MPLHKRPIELSADLTNFENSISSIDARVSDIEDNRANGTLNKSLISGSDSVAIARRCILTSISVNTPCRLRVYKSLESLEADSSRLVTIDPTGNHGLLLEVVFTEDLLTLILTPAILLFHDTDICYFNVSVNANTTINYSRV
ncbi:MAG: hypothetical protein KME52_31850 [Desmonostoc geniculatum HA4340-LM1]|jgi:hypothetical protein|nr:hypothetical protein [Desmonostoc geniculatum HA4340-LM1]